MKAFQLVGPKRAELRDVDVPEPGPSEVLLKVAAAGVCHSDLHLLHAPALPYSLPMTLGHEVAGRVVDDRQRRGRLGRGAGCPRLPLLGMRSVPQLRRGC